MPVIEKATADLRELNGHASFVPSLFSVLCQGDDAEIRKLAAIIFRRKVSRQWKSFNREICVGVRQAVLERLLIENDSKVAHSLCQVAASIAKHELGQVNGTWPDLFEVIKRGVTQEGSRETTLYLVSVVCDYVNETLGAHFIDLLKLLGGTLENVGKEVGNTEIYAVKAFDSLVPYLGDEYVNLVRPLVLKCVNVIQRLLETDEDKASELMEIFETLIETEVSFISPYVKDLVLFSLQIASNSELEDTTRVRALSLLRWIIKLKKKAVIKLSLIEPILDSIFPIITSAPDDDDVSFSSEDAESEHPISAAVYIIDELALHLPPEKLFKAIMPKLEVMMASNDPSHQRGLVLTLACLAEGTSEFIKANHLKQFLEIVCRASLNENEVVRTASLFAIGQFSEHLQPDISKFSSEVMPLLFEILKKTPESNKGITRAYYAVENFVENLDDEILTYLEQLMSHLLTTLQTCEKIHTRELVVSAIGAVANAAKENLLPYLGQILSQLRICLPTMNQQNGQTPTQQNEEEAEKLGLLHMQTLDTLGVLARTVGKNNFLPLAEDCLKLGMNLLENENNDPDMRRSAYGLFSAIATIVEEKMSPFLNVIVKHMLDSLRSTEGVVAHYNEETNGTSSKDFSFLDDSNQDTDLTTEADSQENDDDEDIEGFSVGNSYMDEKSDACEAIGEIAKYTKTEFVPYLKLAFEEVYHLVDFPHSDVRKAAIASSGELTMCAHKLKNENFPSFVSQIFPVICKTLVKDTERLVVMGSIATANQMIECCGMDCFVKGQDSLKDLMAPLFLVMSGKSACQDGDDDEDDVQEESAEAEYDEMLIEYCGEILPVLAGNLGATTFLPYFAGFLPALVSKLKPSCTTSERSFAAGTIAEAFQKLGPGSAKDVVGHVVPSLLGLTKDKETEVRNNSIFGIGVVLQNADSAGLQFYPTALNILSQALSTEKSRGVIDNILGAVARMVMANRQAVPVEQVIPVLLDHLPIVQDHEEDAVVYSCLCRMLNEVCINVEIKSRIIKLFVTGMEGVEQEIQSSIAKEMKSIHQNKQELFNQICQNLEPELASKIQLILG
uniref:importin-4-like isoform X1 n=1 Tax=Styela clava TaxID=7725 RepID=UPI001939B333|nr:importin-4-like isoform X1 [Styela clava]